ncbi:MAG TPA: response regulator [Planctomycetota bacterium]
MSAPRILCVDDHLDVLRLVKKALEPGGYDLRTAPDGEQGLRLARELPPDLIITDVNMPRMDGWMFVKQLRSTAPLALVPVIFLTARAAAEDHIRGFRLGADDYLDKGRDFWELPDRVSRSLARRRELDATVAPEGSLTGRCEVIGLAALLTVIETARRSGVLRLQRTSPTEEGLLFLVDGRIHRAELRPGTLKNREAVFHLLTWTTGAFEFTHGALRTADDVEWPTAQLLIEGARRIDTARARL